ncbi:DUF420 domain-containing protein [Lederbergia panacisoli]|uniref:DUF420 domain-containing protein n=1 Tax=Lederbergia panacisoli TaxID=1255251 RepID=UPI00214BA5B8|nr:DUF420 domain-containing protein [Lederbergia panacisoli]MCR2820845.1 DUF420 domain-containing protein [Lederbergia panacisoli]
MIVPLLPTLSTACIVTSAILVAIGWGKIRKRDIKGHQKIMTLAGLFALIFFIIYSSRTIFVGNTSFGGPDEYKVYYTIFLIFHVTLATIGAVLGIISLVTGYKKKLSIHKKLGPFTSIIWFLSGFTGVIVYLLLYVIYKGGTTTSLIKAILGI